MVVVVGVATAVVTAEVSVLVLVAVGGGGGGGGGGAVAVAVVVVAAMAVTSTLGWRVMMTRMVTSLSRTPWTQTREVAKLGLLSSTCVSGRCGLLRVLQ